ncbi:hypothetical protein ACP70R_001282 [Stipagrostis hirtigluma subsp. patula]
MAGALVSASMGVMDSVIEKLTTLMGEQYEKHNTMQMEAAFLKHELDSIDALLKKLAGMDELDPQAKVWRNQVMDMAFDIEDFIDDFMHQAEESANTGEGFVRKICNFVGALREHYRAANKIKELKARLREVDERRKRYKFDDCASGSSNVAVDYRLHALYIEAGKLVGMEVPRHEIMTLLADEMVASMQDLRVVSIVGFGGLGKTTLANAVYQNLGQQFKCKAFVSVSQRPDLMKLLGKIISKLEIRLSSQAYDEQDLIDSIRECLQDKRYLFVIDDLWDVSVWDIVRSAFPNNRHGSILITTTRIETVAAACCRDNQRYIYRMKPLDDQSSKQLFFSRIGYVPQQFEEILSEILEKCGGMPLAIISIASLLASQPATSTDQWNYVCSSLTSNLRANPTLDGIRQVLMLSYKHLPHHLKPCFLYLGIYPEDYCIRKQDLVRK